MTSTTATPDRRQRPSAGVITMSTVMLALATGIAAAALWPSYGTTSLVILVVVTIGVGSLIAILGAVFHWPSPIVLAATVIAYLALGVPLAIPSLAVSGFLPSLAGLQDLLVGTATSWKQLLTISLPVGSYQSLLIPAFVLILVTVVTSLSIALRAKHGELAVLGPIVVFLVAILIGPDVVPWPFPLAIALTASILVWLSWFRWYRRRESIRLLAPQPAEGVERHRTRVTEGGLSGLRTIVSAGAILAIAAVAAFAALRFLPPTEDRVVLRSAIVQPFDPRDYPSPLSGFRKYEQSPTEGRAMFTVTGLPADARIRIATLDSYDGVVYSVGGGSVSSAAGAFTRVPLMVDQSAVVGDQATIQVAVGGYAGVWLPTVGKLETVSFSGDDASELLDGFYYNDNGDTGAVVGGLSAGDRYTLRVVVPQQPSADQLATLKPGTAQLPPIAVVPEELAAVLDGYVAGVDGAGPRLAAMIDGLRRDGYVSHGVSPDEPTSRSGHAADRITELLTAPRMIGDQEQYAVTAAIMARQLGFPARVVFGFAPTDIVPDGQTVVTGGDVSAWIEVDTTEFGWVAIDPTPPVRPIPQEQPQDPSRVARPQSPVQPNLPDTDIRDTQLPPNSSLDELPPENVGLTILLRVISGLGWAVLVMAILLSPFLTIAVAKWRRRRLRRVAPTPIERISGGWDEFEDAVLDHGYTPGPAPTRIEVAQSVGGTQPFVLAAVADRAIFAPGEPDADQADQLWRSVDELRYSLDSGLTRRERIKALISLRSLGGYSVTSLFKRER